MENTTNGSDNGAGGLFDRAVEAWKKAQVVQQSPSWEGRPEARALAERLARESRGCENKLTDLLTHENQLVVAYALQTLHLMGSERLLALPTELLERRSKITLKTGSFSTSMDLGSLARQLQKSVSASTTADPA